MSLRKTEIVNLSVQKFISVYYRSLNLRRKPYTSSVNFSNFSVFVSFGY